MALGKKGKIVLITAAVPVFLLVAGSIAAKLYFTPERLKALVVPRLEEATRRHVGLREISLSVFPSLAVSVDGLTVSNPPEGTFEADRFLSLENLRINIRILPLLRGNIEIGRIVLDRPQIYCEVAHDGTKNYSSRSARYAPAPASSGEPAMAGGLLLSDLEIRSGELSYVDKKFDSRMQVNGLRLDASAEEQSGQHVLALNGSASIDTFSYGSLTSWYLRDLPVSASLHIAYDLAGDVLKLDDVTVTLREVPLKVSGSVAKLREDTNIMDVNITSPGVQMNQLLSLVPPAMLKKTEGVESSGKLEFSLGVHGPSGETRDPGISGSFGVTDGSIHYSSLPKSITGINLKGSFDRPSGSVGAKPAGKFSIDQCSASLGGNELGGSLSVTEFDNPALSANLRCSLDLGTVRDFYPLEQGTELGGTMRGSCSIEGKAASPQSLRANGVIALQNVTVKTPGSSSPVKNLNGTIAFTNQAVESKQLAMNVGESDMNMSFTLKNYLGLVLESAAKSAGRPSAEVRLTSSRLRMADLMPAETNQPQQKGAPAEKKGGLIPGIDMKSDVSIGKLVTDKFTFDNVHGSVLLSNGVINLQTLTLNVFQGTVQSSGTLDLRDEKKSPFNLKLDVRNAESNELLSRFSSIGEFLFGKFSTSTTIAGDLNDTMGLKPETLLGNGTVQIAEGKLLGLPLMQKLSDVTGLADIRQVNFKDWTNAFSISQGRIAVKDLVVHAGTTEFQMGGSQGLDGSLDYNLVVKLPSSVAEHLQVGGIAGQALQYFQDKDGRINLPLKVSGTQSQPVVQLDAKAQENALKSGVQQKLEEGLKKLFKRP